MKKITLNETDLLKIVKRVLNEQKDRRFNEDEIEFLNFIFERELKPPFRRGEKNEHGTYPYYNRDGEEIGLLPTDDRSFYASFPPLDNIRHKVCSVFGFSRNDTNIDWRHSIRPHLKSWLEDQLNIKISHLKP